jgi:hypothetical protein
MRRKTIMDFQPQQHHDIMEQFLEEAPLLRRAGCELCNSGMALVYVEGKGRCDEHEKYNGEKGLLRYTNTSSIGGKIEIGMDKAEDHGGKQAYFDSRSQAIIGTAGERTEFNLIYNNMRAQAVQQGRAIDGGSDGYSIGAVKWCPGVTAIAVPKEVAGYSHGMFNTQELCGGAPYLNADGVVVYGRVIRMRMLFYSAVPGNIAWLCNVSKDDPNICDKVRLLLGMVGVGDVDIVCHPDIATSLMEFGTVDGVHVVATRNMFDDETHVDV